MEKKVLTEAERNNRVAMIAHTVEALVILAICTLQTLDGKKPGIRFWIVLVLSLGPVIMEMVCWARDKASPAIKHLVGFGFAACYTFVLFTAENSLMFIFAVPMILIVSVYNDIRFSLLINIGTVIESLIVVIVGAMYGKFGYSGIDAGVIQIVIMILIGIYSYLTASTLDANAKQKMDRVAQAQSETETVLSDISEMSEKMKTGIDDIYNKMKTLQEASEVTKDSMQEVSAGATETADAVQNQLMQTEAIQNKVETVDEAATSITENMHQTLSVLENAQNNMEFLLKKVELSVENGADVERKLKELDHYMEEMNSIVEIINGITSQTSLLALNASIEAARAGEAGKGFAVVATEITGMASQTSEATVHITELIQNVSTAINEVVNVIQQMVEGINEEKMEAQNTADGFDEIRSNTFAIRDNVENLVHNIEELKDANQVIVDSIQTISAISEEVSAHANMTMSSEEENAKVLDQVGEKMHELIEFANR